MLWAYCHEDGLAYDVSIATAHLKPQERQCYEDVLLYLHRKEHGHSTLCNHGRSHPRWTRPTNRSKAIPTKRRNREMSYPSLPPAVGDPDFNLDTWLGMEWSEFRSMGEGAPTVAGVYRIRSAKKLVYFGESKNLRTRLRTHSGDERFSKCEFSYCQMADAMPHQLKERETDLIGAYYLAANEPPVYQYKPKMR